MAPETFEGADRATPASDVYAVGAVAYWLVTGRHLFDPQLSLPDLMQAHRTQQPIAPEKVLGHAIDPALQAFIDACLQKNPADRPHHLGVAVRLLDGCAGPAWTEVDARAWWEGAGSALLSSTPPEENPEDATADTLQRVKPG